MKLQEKTKRLTKKHEEMLDESFHSDLLKIMDDGSDETKKAYPEGSFARMFWEEQL